MHKNLYILLLKSRKANWKHILTFSPNNLHDGMVHQILSLSQVPCSSSLEIWKALRPGERTDWNEVKVELENYCFTAAGIQFMIVRIGSFVLFIAQQDSHWTLCTERLLRMSRRQLYISESVCGIWFINVVETWLEQSSAWYTPWRACK